MIKPFAKILPQGAGSGRPDAESPFQLASAQSSRAYILYAVGFLGLGFLAADVSFRVAPAVPFPALWFLPGVLLVAMLMGGTRVGIAALLGALLAFQTHTVPINHLIASLLASSVFAVTGRHFVRHSLAEQATDSAGRFLTTFVLAGVCVGSALAATMHAGLNHLWSMGGTTLPFETAWRALLVGYALGGLIFAPALVLVVSTWAHKRATVPLWERAALMLLLLGVAFSIGAPHVIPFSVYVTEVHLAAFLLVWAGIRLPVRETALCILMTQATIIAGRAVSTPIVPSEDDFLMTQALLAAMQLGALYLSITATGWRSSQARLLEGEEKYRSAMQALSCGVVVQGPDGKIISANPSAERILCLTQDQLLGRTSLDPRWKSIRQDGSEFPGTEHPAMVTLRTGQPQTGVVMGIDKPNGTQSWISINTQPIFDPDTRAVARAVVSFEDITESRLRLAELKQSEQRFRYLSLATRDAVYQWDVAAGTLWRDSTYQQMFSPMSTPTIAYSWWQGQLHRDDKERVCQLIENFVAGTEERYAVEYRLRRWDGRYASVLDRGFIQRDAKGKAVLVVGAITDLTEQQQTEEELRMSQERYRALLQDQHDLVVRYDPDGTLTFVNRAYTQFYEQGEEELMGRRWVELLPKEERAASEEYLRKVAATPGVHSCTESMVRADGQRRTVEWINRTIADAKGEIVEIVGVGRDITDRVEWTRRIEESEKRFQLLAENLDAAFWIFDPIAHKTIYVNRAFETIWRRPVSEALGSSPAYYESIFPEDREMVAVAYRNAHTSSPLDLEYRIIWPGGEVRWISERAFPVCDEKGVLIQWIGLSQDSTARKKVQTELAEKELLYRIITEHSSDLMSRHAPDGTILYASPSSARILGYEPDELLGKKMCDFVHPDDVPGICGRIPGPNDAPVSAIIRMIRKSGDIVWVELVIHPSRGEGSEGGAELHCTTRDITQRVAGETELKRLYSAIEQSSSMIAITDTHGAITYANPAFLAETGMSAAEIIGVSIHTLKALKGDADSLNHVHQAISRGERWTGRSRIRHKSGEQFWTRVTVSPATDASGTITHALSVWENIDAELGAQERLIESDKLTTVGLMAAGVAHEFKNYLGGIIGHASFALGEIDKTDGRDVARESLERIVEMGEKANDVSMGLLTFSKSYATEMQEESLETIVLKAIGLVEKELNAQEIVVVKDFDPTPPVHVAAGKIQQIILNLLMNARHAIGKNGTITVTVTGTPGKVSIAVSDTGAGIPEANLTRIFDPFFSTKGVWGKDEVVGTGMGLSICRTIAREHQGDLTVKSAVGVGTTFTLDLPASSPDVAPVRSSRRERGSTVCVFTLESTLLQTLTSATTAHDKNVVSFRSEEELRALAIDENDLVILDAKFSGKMELMRVGRYCIDGDLPYVVINGSGMEFQLDEICSNALAVYKEAPRLETILRVLASSRV